MSEMEYVIIRAYEFEDEAHLDRSVLDGAGIESRVLGSETAGFGTLSNDAAFQLIVARDDLDRAVEILKQAAAEETELQVPAWTCACGEDVDEGFAVCWSCGSAWPGLDEQPES